MGMNHKHVVHVVRVSGMWRNVEPTSVGGDVPGPVDAPGTAAGASATAWS